MPSTYSLVQRILLIWILVWIAQSLGGLSGNTFQFMAMDPKALFNGDLSALPGMFLWPFVHAPFPSLSHIFFNCYLMWVFGQEVEALYRGRKFLLLCAASIAAGLIVHSLLALLLPASFGAPVVGGSGVVMTMLGIQAAVYPDRMLSLILFQCRLRNLFLVLVALDLLWLSYAIVGRGGGVAMDVHLAGAALGYWWAGGFQHGPKWLVQVRNRRQQQKRQRNQQVHLRDDAELDRILAKISRDGLPSLTSEERRFLADRSRRKG